MAKLNGEQTISSTRTRRRGKDSAGYRLPGTKAIWRALAVIAAVLASPVLGAAPTHSRIFMLADLNGAGRISASEFASYEAHLVPAAQSSTTDANAAAARMSLGNAGSARTGGVSGSIHIGLTVTGLP